MAEGGLFAWKLQSINASRGPAGSYKDLSRPLPAPPKDQHWVQDLDTKEWHLAKMIISSEEPMAASVAAPNDGGKQRTTVEEAMELVQLVQAVPISTTTTAATATTTIAPTKEDEDIEVIEAQAEGPSPKAAFVQHYITPEDTFSGICLRYKVTPTELRRANGGCSGSNLHLMPNPLTIPVPSQYWDATDQAKADALLQAAMETPSAKIQRLRNQCRHSKLATTEAKCYLELNDWDVGQALVHAREDGF